MEVWTGELSWWNATDPIWRVLASSQWISSWTPLKPQHSNPNPNLNLLANQLWCIDFLTPLTPLIITHRLPTFLDSLLPLKNWFLIHARWSKSSLKHFICFSDSFSKFKTEFYCISFCCMLTFDPAKMPFRVMHRKEVTHSNGSYERKSRGRKLADEMGRGKKCPWYTHRLMHRKRVTCELHGSYFRLMTIKHAIPKIE